MIISYAISLVPCSSRVRTADSGASQAPRISSVPSASMLPAMMRFTGSERTGSEKKPDVNDLSHSIHPTDAIVLQLSGKTMKSKSQARGIAEALFSR